MTIQGERVEELDLLLEVDQLEVVSECPESVLLLLLASVLNVRTIKTGIHCQIADSTVSSILATNALQHLKVAKFTTIYIIYLCHFSMIKGTVHRDGSGRN